MGASQLNVITANGAISTRTQLLTGLILSAGGDAATLTITDSSGGNQRVPVINALAGETTVVVFDPPVTCAGGIYAAITGTDAEAGVAWQ